MTCSFGWLSSYIRCTGMTVWNRCRPHSNSKKKKINGHKYMSEIKPWYRVSEIKNRTLALVKKLLGPNKNTMESIYHQTNFRVSKNHSCSNWLMDSLHRKLHQNSQNLGHENWIFVFMFYICITSLKLFK